MRALSCWKQMAGQLVGTSAMLPYMFLGFDLQVSWHSCNVIMHSKADRVEDPVVHFAHFAAHYSSTCT